MVSDTDWVIFVQNLPWRELGVGTVVAFIAIVVIIGLTRTRKERPSRPAADNRRSIDDEIEGTGPSAGNARGDEGNSDRDSGGGAAGGGGNGEV